MSENNFWHGNCKMLGSMKTIKLENRKQFFRNNKDTSQQFAVFS